MPTEPASPEPAPEDLGSGAAGPGPRFDRWWALTGAAAGFLAGPFGTGAGLLLGYMLDAVAREREAARAVASYLSGATTSRPPEAKRGITAFMGLAQLWGLRIGAGRDAGLETCVRLAGLAGDGPARTWARVAAATRGLEPDRALETLATAFGRDAEASLRDELPSLLFGTSATGVSGPGTEERIASLCGLAGASRAYAAARAAWTPTGTDPWLELGVDRDASPAELRRAYRRLSRASHPDAPGGNADRFMAVRRAYEAVSRAAGKR